jgi:hypothetical protein
LRTQVNIDLVLILLFALYQSRAHAQTITDSRPPPKNDEDVGRSRSFMPSIARNSGGAGEAIHGNIALAG